MYAHLAECCVVLPNSRSLIEKVCLRVADLCKSRIDYGNETTLLFMDGEALVTAVDRGLLIWVGATNIVSYHAIRIALEGTILDIAPIAPGMVGWYEADQKRFATIERALGTDIVQGVTKA